LPIRLGETPADERPFLSCSGNDEVLPFSRLRPLDPKFKTLPPQAQEARLSFVKLVKPEADYGAESLDRFRDLAEGRKLMCVLLSSPVCWLLLLTQSKICSANVDYKEPSIQNPLLHLRLIDPKDPRTGVARLPICFGPCVSRSDRLLPSPLQHPTRRRASTLTSCERAWRRSTRPSATWAPTSPSSLPSRPQPT
jgi:hypothetical protein